MGLPRLPFDFVQPNVRIVCYSSIEQLYFLSKPKMYTYKVGNRTKIVKSARDFFPYDLQNMPLIELSLVDSNHIRYVHNFIQHVDGSM